MSEQALTLKAFMRTLAEAATYANDALQQDYADKSRGKSFISTPRPLCVSDMRVSFTANVKDNEYSDIIKNGGDLTLDFGTPSGNFKGEIAFKPYVEHSNDVYDYDDSCIKVSDEVQDDVPETTVCESFEGTELF